MKPSCRWRAEIALGRYLDDAEALEIEMRLRRSATYLGRHDAGWDMLTRRQRLEASARHAGDALTAETDDSLRAFDLDYRLRQAGRNAIGKDFDRLEASGRLSFADRASDLDPSLAGDNDAGALVTASGEIVIFRDRTGMADMNRVLMHEAGAHIGLPKMMGQQGYESLLKSVDRLVTRGDKAAVAARAAVPADTPDALVLDELLAYLVETRPDAGPVRKALAQVKAWAIRAFPKLAPLLADAETLRSLAAMAIRTAARQQGGYSLGERMFVKGGADVLEVDETAARAAFEKRLLHADPAFDAARMDEAWSMHQRYKAAKARNGDLLSAVPGEDGPMRQPATELRKLDRMVERFRGCVYP